MNLRQIGFKDSDVVFSDLKTRYAALYDVIAPQEDSLFARIGRAPGPVEYVTLNGSHTETIQTNNVLEWEFWHTSPLLNLQNCTEANQELCSIIWNTFPIEALDPNLHQGLGFLKEISIRSNLFAMAKSLDSDVFELAIIDGRHSWNVDALARMPCVAPTKIDSRIKRMLGSLLRSFVRRVHGYRFAFIFNHNVWGPIDFDAKRAAMLSNVWAKHTRGYSVTKPDLFSGPDNSR